MLQEIHDLHSETRNKILESDIWTKIFNGVDGFEEFEGFEEIFGQRAERVL